MGGAALGPRRRGRRVPGPAAGRRPDRPLPRRGRDRGAAARDRGRPCRSRRGHGRPGRCGGRRRRSGRSPLCSSRAPPTPPLSAQALADAYAGQLDRIARRRAELPGLGLLVAAESASCLAAVEMTHAGLPWSAEVHDRLLTELLGARPASHPAGAAARPPVLQALAEEAADILGDPASTWTRRPTCCASLRRAGLPVTSTRRHELRRHEHRAVEPLVRYRELARLHAAHGWAWREQWVRDGRFHPEYVPGGVVSGRWATRGGGALQIPKAVRAAVVAAAGPAAGGRGRRPARTPRPRGAGPRPGPRGGHRGGRPLRRARPRGAGARRGAARDEGRAAVRHVRRRGRLPRAGRAAPPVPRRARAARGRGTHRRARRAACAPCSGAPPRRRGRTGSRASPTPRPRRAHAPTAGSPATSSSRPRPPTGRRCCWRPCGCGSPGWPGRRSSCSSSTTRWSSRSAAPLAGGRRPVRGSGRGRRRRGSSSGTSGVARPARRPLRRQLRRPLTRPPQRRSRNS